MKIIIHPGAYSIANIVLILKHCMSRYFCEWYNVSLKSRKLIQFVMHRSLSPCQFTAGGLFVMNMENFGSVSTNLM